VGLRKASQGARLFYKCFIWRLDAIASGEWLSRAYLCLWQRRA